jgi:hypothetical protein
MPPFKTLLKAGVVEACQVLLKLPSSELGLPDDPPCLSLSNAGPRRFLPDRERPYT